ncbi:hypothetical protein HRbin01_00076 [archaeon HR01]|nr:hypothetical protein HRbin01_00076 [archaeon HR01]
MSWLLRTSRKPKEREMGETVLAMSCTVKALGDDLLVEGRARTRRDGERLKRVLVEMLDETLGGGDEAQ